MLYLGKIWNTTGVFVLLRIGKSIKNMNLANRITLFRVVAICPMLIFLSFATKLSCFLACVFFVLAAISDFMDGYIARTQGQVTTFGKFLDPLADKLLICTALIELTALGFIPSWIVIIIIIREFLITGLRAVALDYGIVLAADTFGKWKTTFQISALIPLLLHYPYFGIPVHEIGIILLYIALFFTVLSGVNYCKSVYLEVANDKAKNL